MFQVKGNVTFKHSSLILGMLLWEQIVYESALWDVPGQRTAKAGQHDALRKRQATEDLMEFRPKVRKIVETF